MKGGLVLLLAVWGVSVFATGILPPPINESVTVGWVASADPTVIGYVVLYGGSTGDYTNEIDVGTNTIATISDLAPGATYYMVAKSYNALGIDSIPTREIAYLVPGILNVSIQPGTAPQVVIQFQVSTSNTYQLQASSNLMVWNNIWTVSNQDTNATLQFVEPITNTTPARFYRLVSQ